MGTPVLSAAVIAVVGNSSTERLAGDALYAWVYVVVYVGFAVQSLGIATLFGAQAVRAWPWLVTAMSYETFSPSPPGHSRASRYATRSLVQFDHGKPTVDSLELNESGVAAASDYLPCRCSDNAHLTKCESGPRRCAPREEEVRWCRGLAT
jgi:hypothetical protein